MAVPKAKFDGAVYDPAKDDERLQKQIDRVFEALELAGKTANPWLTLAELEELTGDPHSSVSAQIRHLRKPKFGLHVVQKRRRDGEASALWEYRLIINPHGADPYIEGEVPADETQLAAEAAFWNNVPLPSSGAYIPKATAAEDLMKLCVLNFMSDFYGGSVKIEKMGTPEAENWRITFSVGHQHKKFTGEAPTLGLAMADAVKHWPEGLREWKRRVAELGA